MIQLFPETTNTDVDPRAAVALEERPPHEDRPWVYTNMISSADGGTAVDGLSGALGGPGDKEVFGALRSMADVILAGSSTVSQERYQAPDLSQAAKTARAARGRPERPRLAVVSNRLQFDTELPLFNDPDNRPLIITPQSSAPEIVDPLRPYADFLFAGDGSVDLADALRQLAFMGTQTVLCEGGPSLNGQLIGHGLVDEWNLSLAPHLVSGTSKRAAVGPLPVGPPNGMTLSRVWLDESYLFCRWVR